VAEPPPAPDAPRDGTGVESDRGPTSGTPGWVRVFGIIAIVLVLLVVILLLTGGPGRHGPGRHLPSGGASGQPAPASAAVHGR
jgi:hypothetical protein